MRALDEYWQIRRPGRPRLARWWRRRAFVRQLRMDRITVDELRGLIDQGQELVILDVRPKEARMQDGIIPGAVPAHPFLFLP
jgi:hypothetical protein